MFNLLTDKAYSMTTDSIKNHEAAFRSELKKLSAEHSADEAFALADAFYLRAITSDLTDYFIRSDERQQKMFGILMSSPISQGFDFDAKHLTAEQLYTISYFVMTLDRPKDKNVNKIREMYAEIVNAAKAEI
ncbi:MAG: hypothetical protein IKV41_05900 [Oscillospiraceae bacterium]|nr:hypothetical protein [Oscillospiraceae bacterium]